MFEKDYGYIDEKAGLIEGARDITPGGGDGIAPFEPVGLV